MDRVELGIDGNYGFALLGINLQDGEAEFVEIPQFDKTDNDGYNGRRLGAKLYACQEALKRLKKRLNKPELSFFFGRSHPYGD
jgi:hypothetical protein